MTSRSADTGHNNKTSRSLIAGFLLVLTLMAVISLTGVAYLHRHNLGMEEVVTVHNEKTRLLQLMQDAMRERQISMRDMLIKTDPFERDEAWQHHNQAATRFLDARDTLFGLEISAAEDAAFSQLREAVSTGGYAQQKLVEEILAGTTGDVIQPIFDEAIRAQQIAFEQMQNLRRIQLDAARQALVTARSNYRFITTLTLVIGSASLIAGGLIAAFVVRQFRRNMQQIANQRLLLEDTVDQRTADLRAVVNDLEAYSYSLAHDLRTPLRAVTGFSQLLLQDSGDKLNEDERHQLQRIANAGTYMAQLLDDIRTLARLSHTTLKPREVDLSMLADDELYELRLTAPLNRFEASIQEGLVDIADPELMRLLFHNLFDNSLKFAATNRPLKLEFGHAPDQPGVYCVADNGCGFDMIYARKIFKPFERLHKSEESSGTGIGLAIVERVVTRHGGKIWVDSAYDLGTRIFFTLNASPEQRHLSPSETGGTDAV